MSFSTRYRHSRVQHNEFLSTHASKHMVCLIEKSHGFQYPSYVLHIIILERRLYCISGWPSTGHARRLACFQIMCTCIIFIAFRIVFFIPVFIVNNECGSVSMICLKHKWAINAWTRPEQCSLIDFLCFFCCSFYDKNVARIYASKHYVFL